VPIHNKINHFLSVLLYKTRVGFLPGRKVFLPCHGEKRGEIPFCRGEMAETGEK